MKGLFLFLSLLPSGQALASEKACGFELPSAIEDLVAVAKEVDWHSATDEDVRRAPCARKTPFSEAEMHGWLKDHQSKKLQNKSINGISFEQESPENLAAFEELTTALDGLGRKDPKRQQTFSSTCKKVDCAMKEIFGPETATQQLFMNQKFGMNGSHLAKLNAAAWRKDELDTVLLSLSDFPDRIFPIKENKTLVHFNRQDSRMEGAKTIADATIVVYDRWDSRSPETKRSDLTHELGHSIAAITEVDHSPEWMGLSEWAPGTKVENGFKFEGSVSAKPESIVSKYGMTNEKEDLAESVVAYRHNPKLLQELSPKKYNFIKNVIFDNVEYTSEAACSHPDRLSTRAMKEIETKELARALTPKELKQILDHCAPTAVNNIALSTSFSLESQALNDCYEKELQSHYKDLAEAVLAGSAEGKFSQPLLRNTPVPKLSPEKMKSLSETLRKSHTKQLLDEIKAQMKSSFLGGDSECTPVMVDTFSLQISETVVGFYPPTQKEAFSKIAKKVCDGITKKKNERTSKGLDYTVNEVNAEIEALLQVP